MIQWSMIGIPINIIQLEVINEDINSDKDIMKYAKNRDITVCWWLATCKSITNPDRGSLSNNYTNDINT